MFDYGESGINGRSEKRTNINEGVYSRTIYGQSIKKNPVAAETANTVNSPFVIFQDTISQSFFGVNKDILSLGWLELSAPGGGKTNLFNMMLYRMIPTMCDQDVLIIFDTKGDYLREFGNKVPSDMCYVIGNGDMYKNITSYHNIFSEIMPRGRDGKLVYTEDCDVDALEIATALFQQMQSETQPIFPAMAEQIVCSVLIYMMRKYWRTDQSKLNNREFLRFFQSKTAEELKAIYDEPGMEDQRSCVSYISGKSNQTQGVNSYISSVLRKIFIGPFAKADPTKEISMTDIISGGKKAVIFIEYDLKRGQALAPMYGILIDQALKHALGGRQDDRKNVYLLLDEWALLPKLKHMAAALSFGRSQGVKVLAGLQNVSAIEELYGESGAKNIMAGFQNIICFKLTDYDTRQFMVNRMGENYQNISLSAQNNSVNVQRQGHCLEDWDILELCKGEGIVKLADEKPFLFHFPRYQS